MEYLSRPPRPPSQQSSPPPSQESSPPASEVLKLLAMSTGLAYFIGLILFDAWRSLASKPRIHWIPARKLILTALTLQILSYVDHKNVSIQDEPNYEEAKKLLANQLVLDSGRLVMCVFIGYLLPRMAGSGSATQWGNIAALNLSVFIAIVSELYYVRHSLPQDSSNSSKEIYYEIASRAPPGKAAPNAQKVESYQFFWAAIHNKSQIIWFSASAIVVLVATVMLILLLMSSVLAGKIVRDLVSPRILCILESSRIKPSSRDESPRVEPSSWDEFDEQIMRSWLLSRVGQPQYAISRSVLSSLVGAIVTVCIVLLVVKAIVLKSTTIIAYHDYWDWLRYVTFSLQCLFTLLGWVIILWRWFCGVVYFPKFSSPPKRAGQMRGPRWCMEDFWRRSIYELRDVFELRNWQPTLDRRNKLWAATKSAAKKCEICLPVHFLLAEQTLMVFFSKCCSFFSEKMFCSTLVRRCLLKPVKNEEDHPFKKYEEALEHVCMPGENAEDLWLANERIINEARQRLEKGHDKGKGFKELKTLLNRHFDSGVSHESRFVNQLEKLQLVEDYFPFLNENPWKISAVSLLKIINTVFPSDDMERVLEAYRQAWKLMSFVESSHAELPCSDYTVEILDGEVDRVSLAADREYKRLLRLRDPSLKKDSDHSLKKVNNETGHEAVVRLRKEAEEQLMAQNLIPPPAEELQQIPPGKDEEKGEIQQISQTKDGEAGGSQQVSEGKDEEEDRGEDTEDPHHHYHHHLHLQDSKDWNAVASSYNMYRVCETVLTSIGSDSDERALIDELQKCLADVIGHCLLQLPEALAWRCTFWTVKYEEGRIWEAISIAGKLRGVMEGKWTPFMKELEISKFKWTLEESEVEESEVQHA